MRPLLIIAMIGVGLAFPVAADGPMHIKRTLGPSELDFPAGELCNFNYHGETIVTQNIKRFFDASGNVTNVIRNEDLWVLHRNVDTGLTFTEVDHYTVKIDFVTGVIESSGQNWHLRDVDGRIVLVRSGRFVQDLLTGEILWSSHFGDPDIAQTICTALGGAPAQ